MARIEGHKLLLESGAEPQERRQIFELARRYNTKAEAKIQIYQAFQDLTYSIDSDIRIKAKVKGFVISPPAAAQVISCGYLVLEGNLFFLTKMYAVT